MINQAWSNLCVCKCKDTIVKKLRYKKNHRGDLLIGQREDIN